MKLSIVIPAYNEESYLGECLRHVLDEVAKTTDVGRVEVLVIDNASTDRTSEVAKGFPGVRVAHEPSKGPSHARQRGLDEARGAIIGYVDADTKMPSGWIRTVVQSFDADPGMVCVSGPYVYFEIAGARLLATGFSRLRADWLHGGGRQFRGTPRLPAEDRRL